MPSTWCLRKEKGRRTGWELGNAYEKKRGATGWSSPPEKEIKEERGKMETVTGAGPA